MHFQEFFLLIPVDNLEEDTDKAIVSRAVFNFFNPQNLKFTKEMFVNGRIRRNLHSDKTKIFHSIQKKSLEIEWNNTFAESSTFFLRREELLLIFEVNSVLSDYFDIFCCVFFWTILSGSPFIGQMETV